MSDCRFTLAELLEGLPKNPAPRTAEEQAWLDALPVGREILPEDLATPEAITTYLASAEATADRVYITYAQEIVAQAKLLYGFE